VVEVIQEIQTASGYTLTPIGGTTRPLKDLEGFDSAVSLDTMSRLSNALKVEIPASRNIFVSDDGKGRPFTVDEIVDELDEIVNQGKT
jgi:hypothetical protein